MCKFETSHTIYKWEWKKGGKKEEKQEQNNPSD